MSRPHADDGAPERPDPVILAALAQAGLIDADDGNDAPRFTRLTGGVSSDIWLIQTRERQFCVKRALSKLRVQADWLAPIERNRFEVAWFQVVHKVLPAVVPAVLYHDDQAMLCAMEYLDPDQYRLWKHELRDGRVVQADAAAVGAALGRIHAATANRADLAAVFPRRDIFHAIRLEPYLEATAERHPDLQAILFGLSARTAAISSVMIHGDVSPKNILIGPRGPVFLDAECASLGDPAFDVAFCLNHLLLKCVWRPSAQAALLSAFTALSEAYLAGVDWEPVNELQARAASLLPALLLARVDGKSPVEYLQTDLERNRLRRMARALLLAPVPLLADVREAFAKEFSE